MAKPQLLTDPTTSDSLLTAVGWLTATVAGSFATTVAVVGIAWIGFLALSGRVPVRRSASVVLGCFLLFGASRIATGILSAIGPQGPDIASTASAAAPPPVAPSPAPYDPYAGASVPIR